jgi:replication factor C large subunit
VVGNKQAVEQIMKWLESWKTGTPQKKAILLYGPPGVGKTVISEALARERDMDLVEINASDKRSGEILSKVAGLASTQGSLFAKGRLILLDEVDGINLREDHGAVEALNRMIRETHYPVVLTANDPWDQKIRSLRDTCQLIELKRIGLRDGLPFIKKILDKETVRADEDAIRLLLEKNNGDLRSILNDLQILSGRGQNINAKDVYWLSGRDRTENIFNVLRVVFNAKTVAYAKRAVGMADIEPDMLFQWIIENTPYQIVNPKELSTAMDALAAADLFYARTRRTQDWHLVSYAYDLMTAGVAISKKTPVTGWVPMKFPQRIMAMSRSREVRELRKNIGLKIGSKCHVSSRRAIQQYLPVLRLMYEKRPEEFAQVAEWLGAKTELDQYFSGEQMPPGESIGKPKGRRPAVKSRPRTRAKASDS